MVIKGRSRSNGAQLADYLLNSRENDRAQIVDIRGTAQPDDLKRSLLEMSFSSELTKRGNKGIYHAQMNPAIGEDRPMTHDDWLKAADLLEQSLGLDGQKRAIVLHEKNGRVHGHIVWERYDHDTGKLRSDSHNFKKHDQARAQIEQELGHERTPQRSDREPTDKERLTQLWKDHPEGQDFLKAAEKAGYVVAQGNDRRPFRVVTPDGQSLDLVRQLDEIKTKAVHDRLQPIRDELPTEAQALQQSKANRDDNARQKPPLPEHSEDFREISDSQDRLEAMKAYYKEQVKDKHGPTIQDDITPEIDATPPLPREPDSKKLVSEKKPESSDLTDPAAALLQAYQQQRADKLERQRKAKEMKQQAAEQTKKQEGQSVTDLAAEMLEQYRQQKRNRQQGRDGPEH